MIAFCRSYLVDLIKNEVQCNTVYTRADDESRFKPLVFALVLVGNERLEKDGSRVAKEDDLANGIRRYRYRVYKSTLTVFVTIVGKSLEQSENFRQNFLTKINDRIIDPEGNAIDVRVTECNLIQELNTGSIQNPREGYEFTVEFSGGVYLDKTVNIITGEPVPTPEIIKEG